MINFVLRTVGWLCESLDEEIVFFVESLLAFVKLSSGSLHICDRLLGLTSKRGKFNLMIDQREQTVSEIDGPSIQRRVIRRTS